MWKPMANVLGWPDAPITWKQIASKHKFTNWFFDNSMLELAENSSGWATVGGIWGSFKYGHGHPL